MKFIPFLLACALLCAENQTEKVFTYIYTLGEWDESGFSLSGSQVEITQDYMDYLQDFLRENDIHSVVDLGCGDWAFSRYIDWEGIEYLGIDIVHSVVERNQCLFSQPNVTFIYADGLNMELPEADLFLCKDVFQHLPNHAIIQILRQTGKYKHCLITNYVDRRTLSSTNRDITVGNYHPIDLSKPPFNIRGEKVLNFYSGVAPKQTFHIKKAG
ncbi:MAG: class I SAM-dependent methyltransferase [Simkaniaceae bacterium]|nr:MAG: class I SAM-dependent methyltransferase [Simkaniaceae bacterium]